MLRMTMSLWIWMMGIMKVNSDQDYVTVDNDDSEPDYVSVETKRFRTVSMLILQITEVSWTITVKIYESYSIIMINIPTKKFSLSLCTVTCLLS